MSKLAELSPSATPIPYEVIQYEDKSQLLVVRLKNPSPDLSTPVQISPVDVTRGQRVYLIGLESSGEFSLEELLALSPHVKRYRDTHILHREYEPHLHCFRTNLRSPPISTTSLSTPPDHLLPPVSKPAFDDQGSLLGLCHSANLSVCTHPQQLAYALARLSRHLPIERAKLGGSVKTADKRDGVAVLFVAGGSPLHKMGVKMGDTIRSANGERCESAAELFQILGFSPLDRLTLQVERGGELIDLRL